MNFVNEFIIRDFQRGHVLINTGAVVVNYAVVPNGRKWLLKELKIVKPPFNIFSLHRPYRVGWHGALFISCVVFKFDFKWSLYMVYVYNRKEATLGDR